jgi:hypothetical protein
MIVTTIHAHLIREEEPPAVQPSRCPPVAYAVCISRRTAVALWAETRGLLDSWLCFPFLYGWSYAESRRLPSLFWTERILIVGRPPGLESIWQEVGIRG